MTRTILIQGDSPEVADIMVDLERLARLEGQEYDTLVGRIRERIEALATPQPREPDMNVATALLLGAAAMGGNFCDPFVALGSPRKPPPPRGPHPLGIPCPECGALSGKKCTGKAGKPRDVHSARKVRA